MQDVQISHLTESTFKRKIYGVVGRGVGLPLPEQTVSWIVGRASLLSLRSCWHCLDGSTMGAQVIAACLEQKL